MAKNFYGDEITQEELQAWFNRIPQWYWDRKSETKVFLSQQIAEGSDASLSAAYDTLEFVQYKLDDWASD